MILELKINDDHKINDDPEMIIGSLKKVLPQGGFAECPVICGKKTTIGHIIKTSIPILNKLYNALKKS